MTYNSNALLDSLQADVREIILVLSKLQNLPESHLQQSPAAGKWSIAQVAEHLNIYARHYINAIEKGLHLNQSGASEKFHPGWLGAYFTRLMQPSGTDTVAKKMKAPKNALPSPQPAGAPQLQELLQHQHHLLNLLQIARTANLDYIRIPTSLSPFIRLKLGDTFRFFIAHQQRHFVQIGNILKLVHPATKTFAGANTTPALV